MASDFFHLWNGKTFEIEPNDRNKILFRILYYWPDSKAYHWVVFRNFSDVKSCIHWMVISRIESFKSTDIVSFHYAQSELGVNPHLDWAKGISDFFHHVASCGEKKNLESRGIGLIRLELEELAKSMVKGEQT